MEDVILVVNCGSSSLKLGLFNRALERLATGLAERLGQDDARGELDVSDQALQLPEQANHQQALEVLVEALRDQGLLGDQPLAIGHRVVHGGEAFRAPARLDDEVIDAIDQCAALAPLHNPVNLTGIHATRRLFPRVPQVAVFDTAFHQTLPPHAYLYGLPRRFYEDWGVRRYGFHGTSHQYMLSQSAKLLDRKPEQTSIISAHLGNGCSITAIKEGRSVDTSMGLTPLEGLVMGTRSGDIDPGLAAFLDRKGIDTTELDRILNRESGLLGLSGSTNDMRELVAKADEGEQAANQALDVFCFRLARYIGAMMASLERLDALVFTGGIGENSARVRRDTLAHLGLLGFRLDQSANQRHGRDGTHRIDHRDSRFPILVIATNEEAVIARAALEQGSEHG